MLRITVAESPSELKWTLHGQLAGPWVEQLQTCWSTTQRAGRRCVIDLTNLTAIDESGERVLQAMMNEGAQFRACGVYMTHVLKDLRQRCHGGSH
jgi:anti-anti-sigma regulatory factor